MKLEKDLPECFQLNLTKVIYFATLLLYEQKDHEELFGGLDTTQMREQLVFNLGSLKTNYTNEGFIDQEVKKQILEVESYGHTKSELEKIIANTCKAQIRHRLFNFKEFKDLLSLNERSAQEIIGKDITLVLGSTGCGKSTTVHYLCGSKMKQTQIGKLIHIQPSLIINDYLKKVKCSPLAKSETRYVTPIDIDLGKIGQKQQQIITLVDSPGSQDTESYEVDISNAIGILRAVRQAKGVRLVILFSYLKLGARGEEIKKLIGFYAGMLKDLDKYLPAFSFFFTHVPQDFEISNLRAILEDGFDKLTENEKLNKNLVILFQNIVEKAIEAEKGKSNHVYILRPLDLCPIKLHQSILSSSQIEDPTAFLERIDEKGKFQVLQQFKMHSEGIVSAIKRNDGKYAIDLLDDLFFFQTVFPQDQIFKNKIKFIVSEVIQYGQQLFKDGMQSLEKAFIVSQNNNLLINDFEKFKISFIKAKNAIDPFYQKIQNSFLKDKNSSYEKLQSFQYILHLRILLEESLEQVILFTKDLANPLWDRYYKKYMLTSQFFLKPEMRSEVGISDFIQEKIIADIEKVFKEGVDSLYRQTKQIITNLNIFNFASNDSDDNNKSPIELISENLAQLTVASNQTEEDFFKNPLNFAINQIQLLIKNKFFQIREAELKDISQVVNQLKNFQQQILSEEEQKFYEEDFFFEVTPRHVENITNFFSMHQKLSAKLELIPGINSIFLQELESDIFELKEQLIKFYTGNEEKLKSVIQRKGAKHRNIQKAYKQIQSLRRVPFIKKETEVGFNDVIDLFEQLVDQKQQLVEQLIPNIDQLIKIKGSKIGSPLSQLKDGLTTIMDLKDMLPKRSDNFFLMKKDDLSNKLVQLADKLKEQAIQKQEQLCLEEINIIKELDEIYQQLIDIQQIAKIIECNQIQNIQLDFIKSTIKEILEQIKKTLPQNQHLKQGEENKNQDKTLINKNGCSQIEQKLLFLKAINQEQSTLIKDLGFLQDSKILQIQFISFIAQNANLQYQEFKINLDIIKQRCGLEKSLKKEDNKNDNQQKINIIEIEINNSVRSICDRIKSFKEIREIHPYLHKIFDSEKEVEENILHELYKFYEMLSQQMQRLHGENAAQFNINYTILTYLLVLDSYELTEEKHTAFKKIINLALEVLKKNLDQAEIDAEEALNGSDNYTENVKQNEEAKKSKIKNSNYRRFNEIIEREQQIEMLNKQNSFKVLQQKLQDHIKVLDKLVLDKLKFIKTKEGESEVKELNDGAMAIINLLQEVNHDFIETQYVKNLEQTLSKFYTFLNENSDQIQAQSQKLIKSKKYYESYKIVKDSLTMLNQISLNQRNKEQEDNLDKLIQSAKTKSQKLQNEISFLEAKIKEEVKRFEACQHPNEFISMSVQLICSDLQKITDASDINIDVSSEFAQIIRSINRTYSDSFSKLEEIVEKDHVTASFDNKNEISEIRKSLTYIYDKIKPELTEKINKIEEEIDKKLANISKSLSDILQNDQTDLSILNIDFKKLSESLYGRENNLEADYKIKIDEQCVKMVVYIEEKLKVGPLNQVFDCLGKFYDIQSRFIQPHLQLSTKNRIKALEIQIKEIFTELLKIIKSQFESLNISIKSKGLINAKSDQSKNAKLQTTFQSFIQIPDKFQLQLNPQFQQNIKSLTEVCHSSLTNIRFQFDEFIKNQKFNEAIAILVVQNNIEGGLLCLRDPVYVKFCKQMNDAEIIKKVEYFKQYDENLYYQELKKSLELILDAASVKLVQMQDYQTAFKFDFEEFQTYIEILEIFSQQEQLFKELSIVEKFKKIQEDFEVTISKQIAQVSVSSFESFINSQFNQKQFDQLQIEVQTIRNIRNHYKQDIIDQNLREIDQKMRILVLKAQQDIKKQIEQVPPNVNSISDFLIKSQALLELFYTNDVKDAFYKYQDEILDLIKYKHQFQIEFIELLQETLHQQQQGKQILFRTNVLQEVLKAQQLTAKILQDQFNELIANSRGGQIKQQKNDFNIQIISQQFKEFEEKFNCYQKKAFDEKSNMQFYLKNLYKSIEDENLVPQGILLLRSTFTDLLAKIICIYSLSEESKNKSFTNFIQFQQNHFKPTPEQIVALLRMFGIGYLDMNSSNKIFNNLVDMEQNESNGIVISVASAIFALHGFQVSCACPNEFLCMRETSKYSRLFQKLFITDRIEYKTLPDICKNYIESSDGTENKTDIKIFDAYVNRILMSKPSKLKQVDKSPKILLIYNMESLFSAQFQQQVLEPQIEIEHNEQINKLLNKGLRDHKEGFFSKMFGFLKGDPLSSIDSNFHELVKHGISKEIIDLYGRYKDTQVEKQLQIKQQQMKLVIKIGKFLLSEIPKNFSHIMGLTSNFIREDSYQREILLHYDIQYYSMVPPIINLKYHVENNVMSDYEEIKSMTEIDQFKTIQFTIQGQLDQKNSSILVVFDSKDTIVRFESFIKQKKSFEYLKIDLIDKKGQILINEDDFFKVGQLQSQVNLISREEVVGIDFKVVNDNLRVIQTFIPNSQTEQLNIKGNARLLFIIICNENLVPQKEIFNSLENFKSLKLPALKNEHKESIIMKKNLLENVIDPNLQSFLIKINQFPEEQKSLMQKIDPKDEVSIIIMFDFTKTIQDKVIDGICNKLNEILMQQSVDNELFKFSQHQELLKFYLYFLGTDDVNLFHHQSAKREQHLKQVIEEKSNHKFQQGNLSKSLSNSLQKAQNQKPDIIFFIGQQTLDIEMLKIIKFELPPIYSYHLNQDPQSPQTYSSLKDISKGAKSIGPIPLDKIDGIFEDIEFFIFKQVQIKYQDKMNSTDQQLYSDMLNRKRRYQSK